MLISLIGTISLISIMIFIKKSLAISKKKQLNSIEKHKQQENQTITQHAMTLNHHK